MTLRNPITTSFLIVSILFSTNNLFAQLEEAKEKAIEIINPYMEEYPGLSIAIGMGDEIIWSQGFGYADVKNQLSVNSENQFRYYSISKSITGLAVAKLIEENKINYNSSIRNYIPELPPEYEEVKVKHLINHTAGVRHYNKGEWFEISENHCDLTSDALPTFIHDNLQTIPGETYSYSSFGYVLLSHLVSVVSGQSYVEYVNSAIFEPLGITDIGIDKSDVLNNEVTYYSKWDSRKQKGKVEKTVDNTCKFGGGAFVGTSEGLVKLYLNVLANKVISKETAELFFSEIPTDSGVTTRYAFGIGDVTTDEGMRYHGHTGSAAGASAVLIVYPDTKMVIAILGNINDNSINSEIGNIYNLFSPLNQ